MKVLIAFYSAYGHIYRMAEAVAEGVRTVKGVEVELKQVPETLSEDILKAMGALEARKAFAHIPICAVDDLADADAVIFGTPTRFGNMVGQMRQFLDSTGQLWLKGSLTGKVGSLKRHPTWGAGVHSLKLSHHPFAPRHDHRRPAVRLRRADED